ncbi:response regulator [Mucilaginibacter agri]|uniref:Response regulator n=1 Tax=Mucilaginibacter agri TaxID=2695265 RepID=A0A965ZDZ1_9SPHI|nr:response regulator [Mucilaginibacter agri]NCD68012.1 response regulator [Mucilaginibacter agri]
MHIQKTLLYIDDSQIDHDILEFRQRAYRLFDHVDHYLDGRSAIKFLTEHRCNPSMLPDVIFVDLYMKGYDGWHFLDDYSRLAPYLIKHMNVYIISSSVDKNDIANAAKYKFVHGYLTKPVILDGISKFDFY